jgi:hypothetical protein
MKVRHTHEILEIRSVLISAITESKTFIIWQRNESGEISFQIKGTLVSIDEKETMEFNLSEGVDELRDSETFFAVEDSTVVFKVNKIIQEENKIFTQIPEEAKYKERRRHDRKRFKLKDYKEVELEFQFEDLGEETQVLSKVLNISESGICVLISEETLSRINAKEDFVISAISSDLGFESEKGKIMNARKYKGGTLTSGDFYALGVMFL